MTLFKGHDIEQEQGWHSLWAGWKKEFRIHQKRTDDSDRHESLAAIEKNWTQIRLQKKDDVSFRISF